MPDDEKIEKDEKVAEQTDDEVKDTPEDAILAFNDDEEDVSDDSLHKEETSEETTSEKKDTETETTDKETAKEGDETGGDEEEDEDLKVGTELLKIQKETPETKEKEVKPEIKPVEEPEPLFKKPETDPAEIKYADKDVEAIQKLIPVIPDEVTLSNGEVMKFGQVLEDFPEIPTVVGLVAKNMIDRLLYSDTFLSKDSKMLTGDDLYNELFIRDIETELWRTSQIRVDTREIYDDAKFKEWREKEPDEIKALFNSNKPDHWARGFKRYLNAAGMKEADTKVVQLDEKRKKAKKEADALLTTTVDNKGKGRGKGSGLTPEEEMKAGFEEEEDD